MIPYIRQTGEDERIWSRIISRRRFKFTQYYCVWTRGFDHQTYLFLSLTTIHKKIVSRSRLRHYCFDYKTGFAVSQFGSSCLS